MNDPIPAPEPLLTPEELVARARDLVPFLRERAPELEEKRRISDEVVRRLVDAGIFRTIQPRRFGGYEFDLRTFARVMTELSRGDGAVGWVATLNSGHPFWAAKLALDGQVEVFGADGDFRCPLVLRPGGVARPVDGGYELDGRWDYTSGGEVSNWLGVNAIVPGTAEGDPPSDMVLAFLRRADYEVVDNWFVMASG